MHILRRVNGENVTQQEVKFDSPRCVRVRVYMCLFVLVLCYQNRGTLRNVPIFCAITLTVIRADTRYRRLCHHGVHHCCVFSGRRGRGSEEAGVVGLASPIFQSGLAMPHLPYLALHQCYYSIV